MMKSQNMASTVELSQWQKKFRKNIKKGLDNLKPLCYTIITKEEKEIVKMDKRMFKKDGEELQQYLAFRRNAGRVEAKKGKGSYERHQKHKGKGVD